MLSNDVPATPRPRPPGNVRRSSSMKLQTPPPPYASSLGFPEKQHGMQIGSTEVREGLLGHGEDGRGVGRHALSPIRYDEGEEEGWFNEKSQEELTELLIKADGLIKERENELNLTSAVCKTLYENNVSLKSKHQALLARIPNSPTISSSLLPSPVSTSVSLPYNSPSSPPSHMYSSNSPAMYTPSISPPRPSTKPRYRLHTRRISMSPNDIALLADQNSELLLKLEKLEQESAQADLSGRRTLKRLEREIQVLREELDETQARGEALEEKARLGENVEAIWRKKEREREVRRRRRTSKLGGSGSEDCEEGNAFVERRDFAPPSGFRFPKGRRSEPVLEQLVPSRSEVLKEQHCDADEDDCDSSPPPSFDALEHTHDHDQHSPSSRPNPTLISQLLAKITELEETNTRIMQQQAETSEKLQAVQQETENMSRVYERLGGEGELRWGGEDGETALYFDEGGLGDGDGGFGGFEEEQIGVGGSEGGGGDAGVMRFRSWRRTFENRGIYGHDATPAAEGELDQSTIRSSQKSFGSVSERGTPSRRGSTRKRIASRDSFGKAGNDKRLSRTMGVLPSMHKSRKSVVGLFDPPVVDRTSPTLSALNLEPNAKLGVVVGGAGGIDSREGSASPPAHAPTLDAELGGLGITFDSSGASSVSSSTKGTANHHLRTTSLYDLSCVGSTATTPMHSPSPSVSQTYIRSNEPNLSPTPVSASLPSRMFVFPARNHSLAATVEDPSTPMLPGSMPITIEHPTPENYSRTHIDEEPNQDFDTLLYPNKESKHSLRYRRMTQTVRSRADRLEDGRFKRETLNGLGPGPASTRTGKPVRSLRRKQSTLANAFDVFMEAFVNTMDGNEDGAAATVVVEGMSGNADDEPSSVSDHGYGSTAFTLQEPHSPVTFASGEERAIRKDDGTEVVGSAPERQNDSLPLLLEREQQEQHQHQQHQISVPSHPGPQEIKRTGLTRVILEIWLWLQFVIIIAVFLWAMAKRGPKAVLYEAEKRKSASFH